VRASGSGLVLDRGEDEAPVKLLPEWLARIKTVSEDLRAVLSDAEVCISLTVGSIPDGIDPSGWSLPDCGILPIPVDAASPTRIRQVRHVRAAGERALDARHRPRPNPRRQDLGLPWRRRYVRSLRHDHYVQRAALSHGGIGAGST
jgi:hypothetical protein